MAPLNAMPSGAASPAHPSGGPAANHLAHGTPSRNELREERRRRTNARRTQRKFLVYPADQIKMVNKSGTDGQKGGKTDKNGTRRRTNHEREDAQQGRKTDNAKGTRTEQNGMENNRPRTEQNGTTNIWPRTEQNGMENNRPRAEQNGTEINRPRTEQNGMESNRPRTELNGTANIWPRMEQNGTERDCWTEGRTENGMTRTKFDRVAMNGERTKQNGKDKNGAPATNGTRTELDRNLMNGRKMELNREEMNGQSGEKLEKKGTLRLDQAKRRINWAMPEEEGDMNKNTNWDHEEKPLNGMANGHGQLLRNNGLSTTWVETNSDPSEGEGYEETEVENGTGPQQCNSIDGPLTEDAVESGAAFDGHQFQLGHFAKIHSFWEETPISSTSLFFMEEEEEEEQKQQQHNHRRPIALSPHAALSPHLPTAMPKTNGFYGEKSYVMKKHRCARGGRFVEVPTVTVPWGATAPERLGIRRSKVIMLGDSGVGKTSIVFSHKYGPNPALLNSPANATIGASYTNFDMSVFNGVRVQLQIWDTAGQERFRCMVPLYMRNASAAVLVYDITNRESFEQIEQWHNEVMRCPTALEEPVVVLIGNKADQQGENREVAEGEGVQKALRINAHFFEVSSVDTEVIRAIFKLVAEKIVLQCAHVESAREADEAIFDGWQSERTATAGEKSEGEGQSPVIRLGREEADWATQLLISGRNWWQWAAEKRRTRDDGPATRAALVPGGGNCCAAL